jgi:hypothetical protein
MFNKMYMRQEITYWARLEGDDGYGKQNLAPPKVFKGRWNDKQESVLDARGIEIISKAEVRYPDSMTLTVDGWLYLGSSTANDPRTLSNPPAYQIRNIAGTPDLRNLEQVNVAIL